ncbi:MAG TPA: hypothetical protein VKB27_00465 [Gammaproteobacteria bacterium]|nr:hypothetical protein [Gammaproteobacteria bacterium]
MICPKCRSQMFVADETFTLLSHVTFYRCSLCVGEHVSSEPVQASGDPVNDYFATPAVDRDRPQSM